MPGLFDKKPEELNKIVKELYAEADGYLTKCNELEEKANNIRSF